MLDFGALPPEINSARMYSGPGSGPMMAAAAAWDALAAQLELYAAGYSSTLSDLQSQWSGGASNAMTGAVAPYVAWATTAAAQAEQSAAQARAAAAAYEMAFAATVPPPVVTANRVQLAVLVATNFFGQNTPAIAATEAHYAEMWAQDAAAMYGYAASASAASALTPFTQPPQTTNAGGQSDQATAVTQATGTSTGQTQTTLSQLASALSQQPQTLATGSSDSSTSSGSSSSILTAFKDFGTVFGNNSSVVNILGQASRTTTSAGSMGTGFKLSAIKGAEAAAKAATAGPNALGPAGIRGPLLASVGNAAPVGKLSVPQSWLAANPVADPSQPLALSGAEPRAVLASETHPPTSTLGGLPTGRAVQRAGVPVLRNGRRTFTMPRPLYGG